MTGQNSLRNFYTSVQFSYPTLAAIISEDVISVAMNALSLDKSHGQPAADRLREKCTNLPELFRRVLDSALTDLGYS